MKSLSFSKNIDNNYSNEESSTKTNNENFDKNQKLLSKIKKSYFTLTTDINLDKKENKKYSEDEDLDKSEMNIKFTEKIDYAKKIREAKEIEDLRKIYEKWSGERFELLKKYRNLEDDYYWQKLKSKTKQIFVFDNKKDENKKNNKLLEEEKKIKQGLLSLNNNNLSLDRPKPKPIIINFKNQNYLFNKNKKNNNNNLNNEKKIKDQIKKLNKSFEESSRNKKINNLKLKKLFSSKKNLFEFEKKDNSLLKENQIKKVINNINNQKKVTVERKIKLSKKPITEKNDESLKNTKKFDLSSKKIKELKITDIQIKNPSDEDEKYKNKLRLKTTKKRIIINKRDEKVDLKNIIKKAALFSDKNNLNENLIEKLECALDVDKYIQNEIKNNKDNNLLLPSQAVYYVEHILIRFLGYFGSELTLKNYKTYIEKNPTKPILRDITFKIVSSGLAAQNIYKLVVTNEENQKKYEKNNEEYLDFLRSLKTKISKRYKISEDDIYYFGFNLEKFEVYLLIYNKIIEGLENFLQNYDLKITASKLLNNIILSPNIFDINFSKNENEWPKRNLKRGGLKYYPPYGWYGIGLKMKNKYGKKNNNIWLGKENIEGEWCVAYHGVGKGNVFNKVLSIINGNLKIEEGKLFKNEENVEITKNKYPKCGEGVYLSPNIEDAEIFADKISLGIYNIKFQFVFMTRVNPNKIRSPGGLPVEWILNGNSDEIRPYRLLIKLSSK